MLIDSVFSQEMYIFTTATRHQTPHDVVRLLMISPKQLLVECRPFLVTILEDNPKNEDDPINEDDSKNEDNPKVKTTSKMMNTQKLKMTKKRKMIIF